MKKIIKNGTPPAFFILLGLAMGISFRPEDFLDGVYRLGGWAIGGLIFTFFFSSMLLLSHEEGNQTISTGSGWFFVSILAVLGAVGMTWFAGSFFGGSYVFAHYDLGSLFWTIAASFIILWNGYFYAVRLRWWFHQVLDNLMKSRSVMLA